MDNYRPISVLPLLSKILERHVHLHFTAYLNAHDLFSEAQSGFRANHSCETALLQMTEQWLKSINNGEMVGIVFVDFRKAFDLVDHSILLNKLKLYNCSNNCMKWFQSYLQGRCQTLSVNGILSKECNIKYGVPQGSILGPLLFLLFINDLPSYLSHHNCFTNLFADDTTISKSSTSLNLIKSELQSVVDSVCEWAQVNGMALNSSKTKCMLLTTYQKRSKMVCDKLNLQVDNETIQDVDCEKVLGVSVDENMTWNDHINMIAKRLSMKTALLSRIKCYLNTNQRLQFYKSFLQPHLDYCSIAWSNASNMAIEKIFKIQKRICRIILDSPYNSPSDPLFKTLKI